MKKIYKYFISCIGLVDNIDMKIINIYVELGEPLNTQKSIEDIRNSIKSSQGFDDCTILYMKRVKVERLENMT